MARKKSQTKKREEQSAKDRKAALDKRKKEPPVNYWLRPEREVRVGNEEFRVRGWASGKLKLLDDVVESANWEYGREDRVTASVTLRRPQNEGKRLGIGIGDLIALDFRRQGRKRWTRIFKLRVYAATRNPVDGSATYECEDELTFLGKGEESWNFRKRKDKRQYLPYDIVRGVARRKGVRLGRVYRGKYPIKKLVKQKATALDVVREAYQQEKKQTGKRFILSMIDGKLNVTELKRSRLLYELGPLVVEASVTESYPKNFATIVTARATGDKTKDSDGNGDGDDKGKGKKKKKIEVEVRSRALYKRWGRIHKTIEVEADSVKQARKLAKREMKEAAEPVREVTVSHPGMPGVRRGQAMRLFFPKEKLRQVVFVKEVRHDATPGSYAMELTMAFDDPYLDVEFDRSEAKRCAAAHRRGRKVPDECKDVGERPKPFNRVRRRGNSNRENRGNRNR